MPDYEFRWIDWNIGKCHAHGVEPSDAEYVVRHCNRPFPMKVEAEKYIVWGQTGGGRYLQVIYLLDLEGVMFVIHAMPMTQRQKQQLQRRKR